MTLEIEFFRVGEKQHCIHDHTIKRIQDQGESGI